MRTIEIGDRKTKDLTQDELVYFLYYFGRCGSEEFFNPPIIIDFEYDENFDEMFFEYKQSRPDGFTVQTRGQIYLTPKDKEPGFYTVKHGSHSLKARELSHFISLGFDVPVFSESKKPEFSKYKK